MSQFCLRSRSADSRNGKISFAKQRFVTNALFEEQIYNMFCHFASNNNLSLDSQFPKFFSQKRLAFPFDEIDELRKLESCLQNFKLTANGFQARFSKNPKYQTYYFNKAFFDKKRFIVALKNFKRQDSLFYEEANLFNSRVLLRFKRQHKNKENQRTQQKISELSRKNTSFNGFENEKNGSILSRSNKVMPSRKGDPISEVKVAPSLRPANLRESFLQDPANPKLKRFSELIFSSYKAKFVEPGVQYSTKKSTLFKESDNRSNLATSRQRSRFMMSHDKDQLYVTSQSNQYAIKKKSILNMLKSNYTTGEKIPMRTSVNFRRKVAHNFLNKDLC